MSAQHDSPTDAADAERRYEAAVRTGDIQALHRIALERNAVGDRVGSERVAQKAAELGDLGPVDETPEHSTDPNGTGWTGE